MRCHEVAARGFPFDSIRCHEVSLNRHEGVIERHEVRRQSHDSPIAWSWQSYGSAINVCHEYFHGNSWHSHGAAMTWLYSHGPSHDTLQYSGPVNFDERP